MKKIIFLFCLSFVLISCDNKNQKNHSKFQRENNHTNPDSKVSNVSLKGDFYDIEEFKNFINKKWVDVGDENPCHPYSQSVTVKNGYVYEYNTIEPSEYKIDTIVEIDLKTLSIKIENSLNRDVIFKVEVLNFKEKIVKWSLNEKSFVAKPYDDVCNIEEKEKINEKNTFSNDWNGFYQFTNAKEDEDWREGKDYDLYISLDSVNLKSYGYQHLRNIKCYVRQKEDSLFIYSLDKEYGLLLKLFVKNDKYVVSSLIDKKDLFEVVKKY